MFAENVQRFADVCSRETPCGSPTDAEGGDDPKLLSGYTETNSIHKTTTVNFVLENVSKK
jgi:hypothetical protein